VDRSEGSNVGDEVGDRNVGVLDGALERTNDKDEADTAVGDTAGTDDGVVVGPDD